MLADIIPLARTPPGFGSFTYLATPEQTPHLTPGVLVRIPFRNDTVLGIYAGTSQTVFEKDITFKEIIEVITPVPFLPPAPLGLAQDLATWHRASLGAIIKNILPPLGPRNLKKISLNLQPLKPSKKTAPEPHYKITNSPAELLTFLKKSISKKGQNLWLVPEQQHIKLFQKNFHDSTNIHFVSSQTKTSVLKDIWQQIRSGKPLTVIGTRSALFLPWTNLTQINVIEEGNSSYKSFDSAPRYRAPDLAAKLSALTGATLTFLAATPSVENYSYYKTPPAGLNNCQLVDMTVERAGGNNSVLSQPLEQLIEQENGNVLLLLNRRGSLTATSCRDCDYIFRCPNCQRSLVYFQKNSTLRCLYCQTSKPFLGTCPNCQGSNLKMTGAGTELLERALRLKSWAARYNIVRVDSESPLNIPASKKPLLIVATNQIFSVCSVSDFSLLAILDADTPLFIPEYYATEDLWQRLGNIHFWLKHNAKFLIQTKHPEHPIFANLKQPGVFYDTELAARRLFMYPPTATILKIFRAGPDQPLRQEAQIVYNRLKPLTKELKIANIEAPKPAFPERDHGILRLVIIIKFVTPLDSATAFKTLALIPNTWKIDWNPQNLFSL